MLIFLNFPRFPDAEELVPAHPDRGGFDSGIAENTGNAIAIDLSVHR